MTDTANLTKENLRLAITPSKRKKISKVFVDIQGELVINSIDTLKEELTAAIDQYEVVAISLTNISRIDVSGIQLLHYVSQTNREVSIDSTFNDEQRKLISISGFSEFLHKPKLN